MKPELYLVEDQGYSRLFPLVYSRPVFELRAGMLSLRDHFLAHFGLTDVPCLMREEITPLFSRDHPDTKTTITPGDCIFINGRIVADQDFVAAIAELEINEYLVAENSEIVAVRRIVTDVMRSTDALRIDTLVKPSEKKINAMVIQYPWDLVFATPRLLTQMAESSGKLGKMLGTISPGAHTSKPEQIYIAPGATVGAGVVLLADSGPIFIDDDAEIMPNAVLLGPVYVGKKSLIKVGAKIYGGTSIGDVCKVGGEVEGSVIHGYSNKQHEGFLGHAYIGAWCNLGADTNNSDLKNNYGNVDVVINGEKIDTGHMFVGLIMGDHSKSGINTMFNTGTVVGFSCNVFGADYLPKSIPSFTWLNNASGPIEYRLEKAIEVAERVTARRKVDFAQIDHEIFEQIFSLTEHERASQISKNNPS